MISPYFLVKAKKPHVVRSSLVEAAIVIFSVKDEVDQNSPNLHGYIT